METVILTVHLILALLLIGVVLVQKTEGAALLSGGGNMQARAKPNGLTRFTWILAGAFIISSLTLTIYATRGAETGSVVDGLVAPSGETGSSPVQGMMPPPVSGSADPAAPPAAADPAAPPATEAPGEAAPAETAPAETTPAEPAN